VRRQSLQRWRCYLESGDIVLVVENLWSLSHILEVKPKKDTSASCLSVCNWLINNGIEWFTVGARRNTQKGFLPMGDVASITGLPIEYCINCIKQQEVEQQWPCVIWCLWGLLHFKIFKKTECTKLHWW